MKAYIWFFMLFLTVFAFSLLFSEPGYNGATAGCGDGCHSYKPGIVSANVLANRQVQVTVSGVSQGKKVAGELVDQAGKVVDVFQSASTNPFILTALSDGEYTVNAGYKDPKEEWDSVSVVIGVTGLADPNRTAYPEKMALLGNHPNPFNHETIIKFSLPHQSAVDLLIFDINGKLIRNLSENTFAAGLHNVRWDGRDNSGRVVASGVYFVQLNSENQQFTHRVLLSK